ncbi:MAG: 50S ribosomal protein L18 [Longimicrobiales bacterium]|nr:50S ribosomal protein L18 [Longimicrobiales bacterium]
MTRYPSYKKSRRLQRERRHRRVRKKIWGTAERPRLVVHRSLNHTEGQLVDDDAQQTILGLSTRSEEIQQADLEGDHRKVAQAREAGKRLAERAREAGIEAAVFDRGGYKYHGRVKAFAEGAREGGLEF